MTLPAQSDVRSEAAALGFELTDDQVRWAEMLLSNTPVTFIGSRRQGRDYALKAAAAVAEARRGRVHDLPYADPAEREDDRSITDELRTRVLPSRYEEKMSRVEDTDV